MTFCPLPPPARRTPAQAVKLAQELARLIDELESRGHRRRHGSTELVPEEFSEHWSGTLAFLQIVTQFWPAHLAEHGLVSAVARRKRLMQARQWSGCAAAPPEAPVIVAGLTRADPAALDLIQAVMGLPNGALVLPPLDRTLDEESWASIGEHPEHPQFGLKKLIDALGLARADIQPLAAAERRRRRSVRAGRSCARPCGPPPPPSAGTCSRKTPTRRQMAAALTGM